MSHRSAALSGGEQQRAAVAARWPPTRSSCWRTAPGNLDHANGAAARAVSRLARGSDRAVVVTYNRLLAARADRVLDGRPVPLAGVESMPDVV
jgi:predicted ABC-type transport system involved in lysophospholipase L1 biosynthesis ATPase subunit